VDQRVTVEAKAHIGDDSSADNLTLVGAGATIAQGARVKAGARIKPHARHA
jgi:UDP-3-O-[3-hydroxymyristoyl] glucosamine N-acyltransferase